MIRRPLLIFAVLVLIAGAAVNGGWFYARHIAAKVVDDWVASQRADGVDVRWAERIIAGWPLRLDGRFMAPQATLQTPGRALAWHGPDAAIRFYFLDPDTIDFAAPGRHALTVTENGAATEFTLDAGGLDARTETGSDGRIRTVSAGGTALRLSGPKDMPLAHAKAVQLVWDQPKTDPAALQNGALPVGLRVKMRADQLELAPGIIPPEPAGMLGSSISVIRVQAALNGIIDPQLPVPQALAEWRDTGGVVEAERLEIVWGPVRMTGDGTLALDAALQPEGAFAVRISGLTDILTAMERAAMIDGRTAAIARITLAVLSRPSSNGGPAEAQVPLTIQNGQVSIGPIALFKLPKIIWR